MQKNLKLAKQMQKITSRVFVMYLHLCTVLYQNEPDNAIVPIT
jgi:hypothetical protein